jgi:hypothetical protein
MDKRESNFLFHNLISFIFYKGEKFYTYEEISKILSDFPDSDFNPSDKKSLKFVIDKVCSLSFISYSYRNNGIFFSFPTIITEKQECDMLSEIFQSGYEAFPVAVRHK